MNKIKPEDVEKLVTIDDYISLVSSINRDIEPQYLFEKEEVFASLLKWELDFQKSSQIIGELFLKYISLDDMEAFVKRGKHKSEILTLMHKIIIVCEKREMFDLNWKDLFNKINSLISFHMTYHNTEETFPWAFTGFVDSVNNRVNEEKKG